MKKWQLFRFFILLLFILPVISLLIGFFPPAIPQNWLKLLTFSFFLAFSGSVLALVLSLPLVFRAAKGGILGHVLMATAVIPFFLPISVTNLLFFHAFDGLFRVFGIEGRGTYAGILLAHVFYEMPIIIFYLGIAIRQIPTGYYDTMTIDGSIGIRRAIQQLSMIRGTILQALTLVFLYIFQSTALVMSLGLGQYQTLESQILLLAARHGDFSQLMALALIQFSTLLTFYWLAEKSEQKNFHYRQIRQRSQESVPDSKFCLVYALFFLAILVLWFLPLVVISLKNGFLQLFSLWQEFHIIQSLGNSIFLSLSASLVSLVIVGFWIFSGAKKSLVYTLFISQAVYFSGILFLSIILRLPSVVSGLWGMLIFLMPYLYFFLTSSQMSEDQELIYAARLDGGRGWKLWVEIYWPLWKERWFVAFWTAFILAFGNFSFSYLLASPKFPLVPATLTELTNRRYLPAANALSLILMLILILPLVVLYLKKLHRPSARTNLPT